MRKASKPRLRRYCIAVAAVVLAAGWFRVPPAAATIYSPPYADIFGSTGWGDLDTRTTANRFYTSLSGHYTKFLTYNTTVWVAMGPEFAQSDAIWANFGHGGPGFISWCQPGRSGGCSTHLRANSSVGSCTGDGACLDPNYTPNYTSIKRIRLMVFAGCRTAQGVNLPYTAYSKSGVNSTVGFWDYIWFGGLLPGDLIWAQKFPVYLNQHYTVGQAASLAAQDVVNYRWPFGGDGWDSQRVYGSGIYTEPAAYGS